MGHDPDVRREGAPSMVCRMRVRVPAQHDADEADGTGGGLCVAAGLLAWHRMRCVKKKIEK